MVPLPGVVQAGGKVTIGNSNNEISGDIFGKDFVDQTGNQNPTNNGVYGGKYESNLFTNIPEAVFNFADSKYKPLKEVSTEQNILLTLESNKNYILDWGKNSNSRNYHKIVGDQNSLLLIDNPQKIVLTTWNGILGPTGGKPLTMIFNSSDVTINSLITGDVMIITKGNVTIGNYGNFTGRLCILADGNVNIYAPIDKGLIYSQKDITIYRSCSQFIGQIAAKGDVSIYTAILKFDDSIAKSGDFTFPAGIK